MRRIGSVIQLGFILALAAVFAGCGSPGPEGAREGARNGGIGPGGAPKILLFGNGTEPEGLDPHLVTGVPEDHILCALLEGLVNAHPKTLEPVPGVAETWSVSDDGRAYTFHLRHDAKWSNGDPLTAGDFIYSFKRMLTPALAAKYAYMLHCMKNAKAYNDGDMDDFSQVGAKALDDYTLEVTLEVPTPYFLSLLVHYTWFPVHQGTIEKFGAMDERNTKWTRAGNFVGNGPFVLAKWEPNNIIEVEKSPTYWGAENVKLDAVHFFPVTSEQTEERMFRSGELHRTSSIPLSKIPVYREKNPELLRTDPYLGVYYYRLNVTRPPFQDPRVRRAFAMTIDRQTIVDRILRGGQTPAGFLTPPDTDGFTATTAVGYDVEGARKLLEEAGYPGGKGLPKAEILYNTMEAHRTLAEAIQQMWKNNLGAEVTLTNQDWKVYMATMDTLDYQIARGGWIGDVNDPVNFLECFTTGNGNNRTGYASPEFDALIAASRRATTKEERHEFYQRAEKRLMEDMPVIPIYHYTRVFLIDPRVKGIPGNIRDHIAFRQISLEGET